MRALTLLLVVSLVACAAPGTRSRQDKPQLDRRTREVRARLAAEEIGRAEIAGATYDVMIEDLSGGYGSTMAEVFEAQFGRQPTPDESVRLQNVLATALTETFPVEVWIEALVPVYTSLFSMEELEALAAFYATPEGERIGKLRGIAMRAAGRAGEKLGARMDDDLAERIVQGLIAEFSELSSRSSSMDAQAAAMTLHEAAILCDQVQDEPTLPIGCKIEYFDGQPALMLFFPDSRSAVEYWPALSDEIAMPFCAAANRGNRLAFVFLGLYNSREARSYNCETGDLSDWMSVDDDQSF